MTENQIDEIKFDELHENDTVVLETAHNVYTFRLRDSDNQMGELAGGLIEQPSTAVLGGTVEEEQFLQDRLRVGGRALFFSTVPQDQSAFKRIVTSPISSIRLSRAA
jgi:hypothetical protein